MSTIKSSSEHLVLNSDGSGKSIKFQANGVEKASISSAGLFTATTIDATKLTGNLPAISGASLTNLPAGGKVLQVVSDTTATLETTTSVTYADTALSLSITPTSTSNTILVMAAINSVGKTGDTKLQLKIFRDATEIGFFKGLNTNTTTMNDVGSVNLVLEDNPITTSATTYKVQIATSDAGNQVQICGYSSTSTLIAMEIGA